MPQKRFLFTLTCIFVTLLSLRIISPFASAQENFDDILVLEQGTTVHDLMWSYDSQRLIFTDPSKITTHTADEVLQGIKLTQPMWCQYDLSSKINSCQTTWPLYPALTPTEFDFLKPEGFIVTSPDGDLLAYVQNPPNEYGSRQLVIANRQTGEILGTSRNIHGVLPPSGLGSGNVSAWSDDGTGLAVSYTSPVNDVITIYIKIPDKNNLNAIQVYDFVLTAGGHDYVTFDSIEDGVYDISDNGDRVLLTGRQNSPDPGQNPYSMPTELIVWTPSNPEKSYILDQFSSQKIRAASFAPGDDTRLLILTDTDLIQYDLLTGESTTLRSDFGLITIAYALFSPDGNWLAIHIQGKLCFLNVKNIGSTTIHLDGSDSIDRDGNIVSY